MAITVTEEQRKQTPQMDVECLAKFFILSSERTNCLCFSSTGFVFSCCGVKERLISR